MSRILQPIAVLMVLILLSDDTRGNWPRFRGPAGNGIVPDKLTLLSQPKKLWSASVGDGNASLIIQDGRLYTAGRRAPGSRTLTCLDASTGKKIWEKPVDSWSSESSPTVTKDKGFLLCTQKPAILYCFRLSDAQTIWRKELPGPTHGYGNAGSPLLWRDLVIVNVGLGMALKQETGEIVWQHAGNPGLATPQLYEANGQPAVLIFAGQALYGRDAASGKELFNIPWKTELEVNACDPIYHQGKVFISTDYGKHAALFDITAQPPKQLWKERGSSFSSGILWKDYLYCFAAGQFCCLDFASGARKWTGPRVGGGSALLAGDKLILLSDNGTLYVAPVSVDAFKPMLDTRTHDGTTWTPPSLVNGKLFVRNKSGDAICLQIGE